MLILLMLILFDNGTPRGLAHSLGHEVREARALGWDRLTNGELLSAAEEPDSTCCSPPTGTFPTSKNLQVARSPLWFWAEADGD